VYELDERASSSSSLRSLGVQRERESCVDGMNGDHGQLGWLTTLCGPSPLPVSQTQPRLPCQIAIQRYTALEHSLMGKDSGLDPYHIRGPGVLAGAPTIIASHSLLLLHITYHSAYTVLLLIITDQVQVPQHHCVFPQQASSSHVQHRRVHRAVCARYCRACRPGIGTITIIAIPAQTYIAQAF
jgi:hypothetical protein